jgi:hypothetical protein
LSPTGGFVVVPPKAPRGQNSRASAVQLNDRLSSTINVVFWGIHCLLTYTIHPPWLLNINTLRGGLNKLLNFNLNSLNRWKSPIWLRYSMFPTNALVDAFEV